MSALNDFVGPLAASVAWSYLPMPSVGNWALKVCQYYTHFNCQAHESAQPSLPPNPASLGELPLPTRRATHHGKKPRCSFLVDGGEGFS